MRRSVWRASVVAAMILAGAACRTAQHASEHATPNVATDTPHIPARQPAVFPPEWRFQPGGHATFAPHRMVVSNSMLASRAGVEIMARGGNAVDAAVAVGFALAVTYPAAGNLGGGGFMVIRMADGRTAALDYREIAPLAATRDMYVGPDGQLTDRGLVGALASGVPGAVAGMAEALRRYGTMSLAEVMAPAIRLADEGFVVDSALWRQLLAAQPLITRFAGATLFYPGGEALVPGTRLRQPDLARTLRAIADRGPSAFYTGPIADSLVAEMQRDGGIITRADLARYRPLWRTPVEGTFRGYRVISMPPSSSGGTTLIEALNILDGFPDAPFESATYKHLYAEAFRRAFVDRNTLLGDPAFVHVPVEHLVSRAYADSLRATIDVHAASRSPVFTASAREGMQTTSYSVVDAQGNAVATTTTINSLFGSGVWVRGAGFFLNNEMDDFTSRPGVPNQFGLVQGEANAIAPGKRMLSAMAPTIVLDPDGQLLLVLGAAGGPTIITAVASVTINVIEHRMSLADAVAAPRIHHQAWPDSLTYERGGLDSATIDSLHAMGHRLREVRSLTNLNAIMRVPGGYEGVPEPRASGGAAG
ncbi:MAG TPA: gamma-glutamyltransferase [Gemmatimonadaceae bacterium]|nr:gamma-glutamyltransferase [Gemmatimonadaceae bacterium]